MAALLTRAGQVQTMTKSKLTYYFFLLIAHNTNSLELNALLLTIHRVLKATNALKDYLAQDEE